MNYLGKSKKIIREALFIIILSGLVQGRMFAQIAPIATDRPDQTECPFIVPANHFQMETGFIFENTDRYSHSFVYPTALLKYGLNNRFELRLITEFKSTRSVDQVVTGLSPVTIGFKINLTEEKGILPTTSFIGHLTIPDLASSKLRTSYYAPAFRFTMQHTLSRKISLAYNLGAEFNGESPEPSWLYTLTTGCSISDKWSAYIELYGFASKISAADHRFDCGLAYLVKPNILIDISGGFGLTESAPNYYTAVGFSLRLNN